MSRDLLRFMRMNAVEMNYLLDANSAQPNQTVTGRLTARPTYRVRGLFSKPIPAPADREPLVQALVADEEIEKIVQEMFEHDHEDHDEREAA